MRRAQLGVLRTQDYIKYEWLLEKLNVVYKPRPFIYERIIRRRHTERLVHLLCDETRDYKMLMMKDRLEEDQPEFLKRKAETYQKIMAEEQKFGFKPTIQQSDIDEIHEEIKKVEERNLLKKQRVLKYHIFKEPTFEEEHKVVD